MSSHALHVILLCGCPLQPGYHLVFALYGGGAVRGVSRVLHQPPGNHDGNYLHLNPFRHLHLHNFKHLHLNNFKHLHLRLNYKKNAFKYNHICISQLEHCLSSIMQHHRFVTHIVSEVLGHGIFESAQLPFPSLTSTIHWLYRERR